jgi:YaiO family outer membrane protein
LREKRARLRHDAWRWRYAFNLSYSDFSTANREEWRETFQQLAWRASDNTELQARLESSQRFGFTDNFLALGVSRRFSPRVQGYLQFGGTPNAQFRERTSVLAGTAIRFDHSWSLLDTTVAALDVRLNEYAAGRVETYLPGIEQYFGDGRWWLSARGIYTNDELGRWQSGWMLRADLAITEGLSVFAGYADAPEYSGNATLDSRSPFGGLSIALSDACTANVSYAREDRPNVYVRTAWTAGASCKL